MKGKRSKQEIQRPKNLARTIEKMYYPVSDIKKSLKKIEAEVIKLKSLTQGLPAVGKNIAPVMAFIDILKFHLCDLKNER